MAAAGAQPMSLILPAAYYSAAWRCVSGSFRRFGELGSGRRFLLERVPGSQNVITSAAASSRSSRILADWVRSVSSRSEVEQDQAPSAEKRKEDNMVEVDVNEIYPRPSSIQWKEELANTVHLIGRLEEDVKVRFLPGRRSAVANAGLAVWKGAKGESPSWFDLEFEGSLAVFAGQCLKKGNTIHVTGNVMVDTCYENDVKRRMIRVIVQHVNFIQGGLNSKARGTGRSNKSSSWTKSLLSQGSGDRRTYHPEPTQWFTNLQANKVCSELIKWPTQFRGNF